MVATRILLDRQRPCLACGAPWRVVNKARISGKPPNTPAVWAEYDGECSGRCWEADPDSYQRGLRERADRGWVPDERRAPSLPWPRSARQ